MATRETNSTYRIGADSTQVLEAMRQMGAISEEAFLRMRRAAEPTNDSMAKLDHNVANVRDQLRSTANSIAVLDGPLGGIASRINALATSIGRVGVAGAAAMVAIAGLTFGISASIAAQTSFEQSHLRLEQVLRATGSAAGFTARQIDEMSRNLGMATLTSATEARDAAQILLTFRSIQNRTFSESLRLGQDLSAVFGPQLSSSVTMLGKALEDPIRGLTALSRVGVTFTSGERELIKTLQESGNILAAQGKILGALERQVGGAGAAEAGGLTGSVDTLREQFRGLMEDIGRTTGAAEAWGEVIKGFGTGIGDFRQDFFPRDFFTQIERARQDLDEILQRRRDIQQQRAELPEGMARILPSEQLLDAQIARAEAVLSDALRRLSVESEMQAEALSAAEGYRIDADISREFDRAASIQAVIEALEQEIGLIGKSTAEKELAIARSKDMAEATDEEAAAYLRLIEQREAQTAAEQRRVARVEFADELQMEASALHLSEAGKRIAIQLAGDYRDATALERNAMIDLILSIEGVNDAREREIELRKARASDDKVIRSLEQEIALREAATEAQKRSIQTLDRLSDDVDPEVLAQLERLLDRLEGLDARDAQRDLDEERQRGVQRAQEFISRLELERDAFSQTEEQARKAAAAQSELAGATAEQIAQANKLIDTNAALAAGERERAEALRVQERALAVVADLHREIAALSQSPAEQALGTYLRRAGVEAGAAADEIRGLVPELLRVRQIVETAPRPRDKGLALDEMALATNEETKAALRDQAAAVHDLVNAMRPGAAAAAEFRGEVALLNSTIGQEMLQAAGIDHAEAMRHLRVQYIDTSSVMVSTMRQATASIASSFAQMVKGVRISIAELATDLAAFAVQTGIQRGLNYALDSFLINLGGSSSIATGPDMVSSSITARQFHYGGPVNDNGGPARLVPSSLFLTAPRYHNGLGLAADEMPAILQRGERVIPKGQSGGGSQEVRIKVVGDPNGGDQVSEVHEPGAGKTFQLMLKSATLQTLAGKEARMMMARMYGLRSRTR